MSVKNSFTYYVDLLQSAKIIQCDTHRPFFSFMLLFNFNIVLLNDQIFAGPEVAVKSGNVNLGSITLSTTNNSFDTKLYRIVSVLRRYTVKYSLSSREIPRAKPKGFSEGSGYISQYIPT